MTTLSSDIDIESKYITNVENLIPRPDIALKVLSMAHDANSSIPELAKKIEQDPNLTANMLRMANSSYFGFMREISSIKDIIIRLGFETIKLLAITGASAGLLNTPQKAYGLEARSLWNHSFACAILGSIIARYARSEENFSIYTAGLLHDIGKVLLNKPLHEATLSTTINKKFSSIIELERSMLQTDHAKVGMVLLQSWGLPDSITIPVGYHHSRDGKEAGLLNTKIITLANFLVESIGIRAAEPDKYLFQIDDFLEQNQNLPEVPNFQDNMETIIDEFYNKFNDAAVLI